jgi:hypothetical protein
MALTGRTQMLNDYTLNEIILELFKLLDEILAAINGAE